MLWKKLLVSFSSKMKTPRLPPLFDTIGFKIQYLSLLKCRGTLIYPVRNNAPLEFLTGFTSGAIFSTIFMIALRSAVPIGTSQLWAEPVTG